jgi:ATP-dependent protease ClpP protease subunit
MSTEKSDATPKARRAKSKSSLDILREAQTENVRTETELLRAKRAQVEAETVAQKYQTELELPDLRYKQASDDFHRVYNFVDEVSDRAVYYCIQKTAAWARLSSEPIVIRYNSPGGSVYDGLSLYDHLKALDGFGLGKGPTPITTVSAGMSASMAGILTQAGSTRIIAPNAHFMVHEVAEWSFMRVSSASQSEDEALLLRKLNDRLYGILAERATMSPAEMLAKSKYKEWWLDAEEAIKVGFFDSIGYR